MPRKTYYEFFQGKGKWARLDAPDTKFNTDGRWSIVQCLNNEGINKFLELKNMGLKNQIKKDDDGTSVTWSRPCQKMIRGKLKAFEPVQIVDKDGRPLPRSTQIGNGSDVTCKIEIYFYNTPQKIEACAARLVSVRIDNLIEYTKEDLTPTEEKAVKGLNEQPEQLF